MVACGVKNEDTIWETRQRRDPMNAVFDSVLQLHVADLMHQRQQAKEAPPHIVQAWRPDIPPFAIPLFELLRSCILELQRPVSWDKTSDVIEKIIGNPAKR